MSRGSHNPEGKSSGPPVDRSGRELPNKADMTGKNRLAGLAMYGIVHVTGTGSLQLHHNGRLLPSDGAVVAGNGG